MLFCSLIKGVTSKICRLQFVLIKGLLLNLSRTTANRNSLHCTPTIRFCRSLSDNKTALVLKQQQKTFFFLTVKTRAPGRRCSLPINQHLAHECIAAISWCASAMNQAATETGEQARRRQVMSWLVVGLLTSRQRHRKTPSTALRHPSFGGRCRKAVLGCAAQGHLWTSQTNEETLIHWKLRWQVTPVRG